jgi:hypothetical protein
LSAESEEGQQALTTVADPNRVAALEDAELPEQLDPDPRLLRVK